jgi:hypothetical protein
MKFYIIIFLIVFNLKAFSYNIVFLTKNDTLIANNNSAPEQSYYLDSTASSLFNTNPIFKDFWDNNHLFVYKSVNFSDLSDTISLNLSSNNDKFCMNWFGSISSLYGQRWGRKHEGLDIPLHIGDTVVASFDGIVRFAKSTNSGYGNCIIIRHLNGLETLYGHLSKIEVAENQFVKSGDLIGLGGSTGKSTGPHLHFETRYYDYSFNPTKIIDLNNRQLINSSMLFSKKELFPEHFYAGPTTHAPINNKKNTNKSTNSPKSKIKYNKNLGIVSVGSKKTKPKKPKKESTLAKSKSKRTDKKNSTSKKTSNQSSKIKKPNQKSVPQKTISKKSNTKQTKKIPPKEKIRAKSKNKKS